MSIGTEDRKFGVDSYNLATKAPKTTFSSTAHYLGVEFEGTLANKLLENFVMNEFVEDDRGLLAYQTFTIKDVDDESEKESSKTIYYTEEMVAQIIGYGKFLAERQAGGPVVDTVLTVPSYFTQEQRRMLQQSAEIAGLNVIQLVHENTAAALMFGIDRLDSEKDVNILYYNMGATDTEVSVVRYSAVADAKNKTFEHVEVLSEAFDKNLGGNDFDLVLFNIFADKFNSMP